MKFITRVLFCLGVILWVTSPLHAQAETKMYAIDGEEYDRFGRTTLLQDDDLYVASDWYVQTVLNPGCIYVYNFDGSAWNQMDKLIANVPRSGAMFGSTIAIDDDVMAVGAPGCCYDIGEVHIFNFIGSNWLEQQQLVASDTGIRDRFGDSLSIDGDRLLIGASQDDHYADNNGVVYYYHFNGVDWIEEQHFYGSYISQYDAFGWDIVMSGDTAFITAPGDHLTGNVNGAVYVFEFNGTQWIQTDILEASGIPDSYGFARSIDVDGTSLAVGANFFSSSTGTQGAICFYEFNGTNWVYASTLFSPAGGQYDDFGGDVHFQGDDTVSVSASAFDDDNRAGAVYTFWHDGVAWRQTRSIAASDLSPDDYWGSRHEFDADRIVVGYSSDDDIANDAGAVYIYDLTQIPTPYYYLPATDTTGIVILVLLMSLGIMMIPSSRR